MGYAVADAIVGLKDYDIKNEMVNLAEQFIAQDKAVLKKGNQQHIDIGYYANGDFQIHLSTKKLLRDSHHHIVGTTFHCVEIQAGMLKSILHYLLVDASPKLFTIGGQYQKYQLSQRESEVLFFLIRGCTAKEIASKFNLSKKTVEYYTEQLKNKLGCTKKSELIEKAINLGFIFNLPSNLLSI